MNRLPEAGGFLFPATDTGHKTRYNRRHIKEDRDLNTMTQTMLEQLIAKYSQNENTLAILAHQETPNVVRIVCYTQDRTAYTPYVEYIADALAAVEFRSLEADDRASKSLAGALRVMSLWRDGEAVYDPQGLLAARKAQAENFQWDETLQQHANTYASQRLYDLMPMVQTLIYGVQKDDWSLLSLDSGELGRSLGEVVLVQRGEINASHSAIYRTLQRILGEDSNWWREFSVAVGLRLPSGWLSLARMRGIAALKLYQETAKLFAEVLEENHRVVIETTARLIDETVGAYNK